MMRELAGLQLFDLAHARAALTHIPERRRALERIISAIRPGGWLMIEDVDMGENLGRGAGIQR